MHSQRLSSHPHCIYPGECPTCVHSCSNSDSSVGFSGGGCHVSGCVCHRQLRAVPRRHCCDGTHDIVVIGPAGGAAAYQDHVALTLLSVNTVAALFTLRVMVLMIPPKDVVCPNGDEEANKLQELHDGLFCWSDPLKGFGWAEDNSRTVCPACQQPWALPPVKHTWVPSAM